jgi:2-keto-3-deoxy-L-rhamnonate aldolase RhmA
MRSNRTLDRLRNGEPAIGTWLQLNNFPATHMLAAQGTFAWMLVDFEHGGLGPETASVLLSTIADLSQGRITPLARAADTSQTAIKLALDCGAWGVILPMVEDAETALRAVRAARYPPQGERGAGGVSPHLGFGASRPEYLAQVNGEILVGVQIETRNALNNLDAILAVPGLDIVFIGPNDLHMSLGLKAKFWSDHPDFLSAVEQIKGGARRAHLPIGTLCRDAEDVQKRQAEGFTFLGLGSDAHFMLTLARMEMGKVLGLPPPTGAWCDEVYFP